MDQLQQLVVLLWSDDLLALAGLGLFHMGDWGTVNMTHFYGPVQRPLDGQHAPALHAIVPAAVAVSPLLDVEGPQLGDGQIRLHGLHKTLDSFLVPIVGARRAVLLAPIEESVTNDDECPDRRRNGSRLGHQLMVSRKCGLLVGAEIDLPAGNLNVPDAARRAEKRLGKLWHNEPPDQPGGPKVRQCSAGSCHSRLNFSDNFSDKHCQSNMPLT